jgi:hypothetical protein
MLLLLLLLLLMSVSVSVLLMSWLGWMRPAGNSLAFVTG